MTRTWQITSLLDKDVNKTWPVHLPPVMAYVNLYKPPAQDTPIQLPDDDDPLDLNFSLPIPDELSSDRVKLVPFIVSRFAKPP